MILDEDKMDIERIQNLVQIFGWAIIKQELVDQKLFITLTRDAKVPEVELDVEAS